MSRPLGFTKNLFEPKFKTLMNITEPSNKLNRVDAKSRPLGFNYSRTKLFDQSLFFFARKIVSINLTLIATQLAFVSFFVYPSTV